MNKIVKRMKELIAKGFATSEEKTEVVAMFEGLAADEQATVKSDVEQVKALQETDPSEDDIAKGVREIVKAASQGAVAELKATAEAVKADVAKWLGEQADIREKKVGIYHPQVQDNRKKLNEYVRSFLGAVLDNDVDAISKLHNGLSRKELTTDATGTPFGGYVVNSELSAEIRHLVTEYGVARREMTALQLSKHEYRANTLVTDISVYWVDEGAAIKSTGVVLGQEKLVLEKLGAIVALTRELLEDQEVDLFGFIAGRVAEKLAQAEDLAGFLGDGSGTYGGFTGILKVAGANEVTMTASSIASMTADDLLDMQDKTPTGALPNAKYYMHRTLLSVVRKLKDDNHRYIYQEPAGTQPALIWNKPVVLVEAMPSISDDAADTAFVLFGDLKQSSIFGYKGAIAADRFNAGVVRNIADNADINLITTDREAIRWIERVGVLHLMPQAATRLVTGGES